MTNKIQKDENGNIINIGAGNLSDSDKAEFANALIAPSRRNTVEVAEEPEQAEVAKIEEVIESESATAESDLPKITRIRAGLYEAFGDTGVRFIIEAKDGKWYVDSCGEYGEYCGEFKTLKAARYVVIGY